MQRITLSGMILGLLLSCSSGVVRASQVDELREKAKAMRKEASALAEQGDKEQAEKLEKESMKLLEAAERMERKDRERGEKRDRPDIDKEVRTLKDRLKAELPPEYRPQAERLEAVARRIHHIRVAAENLKLAEAHDLAHQLMEKAEVMERELQEGKQRLAAEMQKRQGVHDAPEIVRDLRAENERLRSEINELRQKVEKR
jgi:hypothetical protein